MKGPLFPVGAISEEVGFLVIFFLGLAFGYFLERAGFGSAKKLTSIFYFKDWSVLRVMFTAIVVAMIGLLYMAGTGAVEMDGVSIPPTFLGAQIVGGLLLGVGFIVGGYCPGTSIVAAASGKADSFFYIGGVLFGTWLFGAGYDWLKPLYLWGEMGVRTVPEWLGVTPGVVALGVALMAVAAFGATELAQRSNPEGKGFNLHLTYERAGAMALGVAVFGLLVGYAMTGSASPVVAGEPAKPAAAPAAFPSGVPGAAPAAAPVPLPGGVRKFKKGSSCS